MDSDQHIEDQYIEGDTADEGSDRQDGREARGRVPVRAGRRRAVPAALAGIVAVASLAWGCTGSNDSAQDAGGDESSLAEGGDGAVAVEPLEDETARAGASAEGAPDVGDAAVDSAAATDAVEQVGSATVAVATAGRQRTQTATLDVEVDDVPAAVAEGTAAVEGLGGFSSSEEVDLGDGRRAVVTYRVPADSFRSALEALASVGDVTNQQVRADDVTATFADLEGRVATLRKSIARLQSFLAEATDVFQVAALEGELTRREAEFESVESQRRALEDRIALSTVTVSLEQTGEEAASTEDDRTLPTFLGGLEEGWDALVATASVAAAGLGLVLPFLPVVLAVALALRWVARRRGPGSPAVEA